MLLEDARSHVVSTCNELQDRGLVLGTAGNVSVRVDDLVVISPSGVKYESLTPGLVGVHRLDGSAVEAPLRPSSELPLHLAVYAACGSSAIIHTHSVVSTALSTVVDEVPASHYYSAMFGGRVRVAPYATFGSAELAANVALALAGRTAALMSNHGAVALGDSLTQAFDRVEYLEYICDVHLRALSTGLPVRTLDDPELDAVIDRLENYGQTTVV